MVYSKKAQQSKVKKQVFELQTEEGVIIDKKLIAKKFGQFFIEKVGKLRKKHKH